MTDAPLIRARWSNGFLTPLGNWSTAWLHDTLKEGEVVTVTVDRGRNMTSHRHEFAWLRTAWENLPEELSMHPMARSPETLRKHALIATGHCDVQTLDGGSKAGAERLAAYVGNLARKAHGYCVMETRGPLVVCSTPHSQSMRTMGGETFKRSKADILEWIGARIGVEGEELERAEA